MKQFSAALAVALLSTASLAACTVPGFTSISPAITGNEPHLLVRFQEEGLVQGKVTLRLTAVVETRSSTSSNPIRRTSSTTQTYQADPNGSISSEIELVPVMPPHQQATEIAFTHIVIEDVTNGVPAEADSDVSKELFVSHMAVAKRHHQKRKLHPHL